MTSIHQANGVRAVRAVIKEEPEDDFGQLPLLEVPRNSIFERYQRVAVCVDLRKEDIRFRSGLAYIEQGRQGSVVEPEHVKDVATGVVYVLVKFDRYGVISIDPNHIKKL